MPARRDRGAQRGALSALLGEASRPEDAPDAGVTRVSVAELRPNPGQPRRHFPQASLESLAQSLRTQGVLQPLLVRRTPRGLEIVSGERRWRAARLAGLADVPVVVRDLSDAEAGVAAAVENLQREDLSVIDEVDATLTLVARTLGVDVAEVPGRLNALSYRPEGDAAAVAKLEALFEQLGRGTWVSFAKNKLRVLGWPPEVLAAMRERGLGFSLAGVVAGAPPEFAPHLLDVAGREGTTVAALREELARLRSKDRAPRPTVEAGQVARLLTNRSRLAKLDKRRKARLEKLLVELHELFQE